MNNDLISIVVPVYNEAENLPELLRRLSNTLKKLNRPSEIIFVNDGSNDLSLPLLLKEHNQNPNLIHIVDLNGNFGQHMAIMAGFKFAKGSSVITMDADLQNPPEEIPNIISQLEKGHDVVSTVRLKRKDTLFRRTASKFVNKMMNKITGFNLHDYGCMLRGYDKSIVKIINEAQEISTFIPALAQKFAVNPIEINVAHNERQKGTSKYSLPRLIRLHFDLMTAFSIVPLQLMAPAGLAVFTAGVLTVPAAIFCRWNSILPVNFILSGIIIFCLGVIGEYVGRIYQEVRKRPRYVIKKFYGGEING